MYFQKWNCYFQHRTIMFCLLVPTLVYLWEIYIFCCREICGLILGVYKSLTDECGHWDEGRAIPRKGISFITVLLTKQGGKYLHVWRLTNTVKSKKKQLLRRLICIVNGIHKRDFLCSAWPKWTWIAWLHVLRTISLCLRLVHVASSSTRSNPPSCWTIRHSRSASTHGEISRDSVTRLNSGWFFSPANNYIQIRPPSNAVTFSVFCWSQERDVLFANAHLSKEKIRLS